MDDTGMAGYGNVSLVSIRSGPYIIVELRLVGERANPVLGKIVTTNVAARPT